MVNDVGATVTGDGTDASLADEVVAEIRDVGGTAIANHADVSDWDSARALVDLAVRTYGDLDVLVNNAGIIRDRPIWDLTEEEYDSRVRVNLKGHVAPTRWAAALLEGTRRTGRSARRGHRAHVVAVGARLLRPVQRTAPRRAGSPRSRSSSPRSSRRSACGRT